MAKLVDLYRRGDSVDSAAKHTGYRSPVGCVPGSHGLPLFAVAADLLVLIVILRIIVSPPVEAITVKIVFAPCES